MGNVTIVTGAAGFLGKSIVSNLIANDSFTIAVVRPGCNWSKCGWKNSDNLKVVEIDLASKNTIDDLTELFSQYTNITVIHCAGVMSGNEAQHKTGTIEPTRRLIDAMLRTNTYRLVLLSSFSVYGYSALPNYAVLDETTPVEHYIRQRDAYSNAKIQQELLALDSAQTKGLNVSILRAGAIVGQGKEWTSRIGFKSNKIALIVGGKALIPAVNVDYCASSVVTLAHQSVQKNEVFIENTDTKIKGSLEIINIVESDLPTQNEYFENFRQQTHYKPLFTLRIPFKLLQKMTSILSLVGIAFPRLYSLFPGIFQEASMCARFKPLHYDNSRLEQRLNTPKRVNFESGA